MGEQRRIVIEAIAAGATLNGQRGEGRRWMSPAWQPSRVVLEDDVGVRTLAMAPGVTVVLQDDLLVRRALVAGPAAPAPARRPREATSGA